MKESKKTLEVMLFLCCYSKSGTIYLLLSESYHHLTPSNVTSQLTILPGNNTLMTYQLPCISDLIFNCCALPNFLQCITR